MKHSSVLHHQSKRRRITTKCEPYPHPDLWVRFIDYLVILFGLVIGIATVPQAWIIWSNKSAEDVSLVAWSVYAVNAAVLLLYSLVHREYPLVVGATLLIVLDSLVVVGVVLYG